MSAPNQTPTASSSSNLVRKPEVIKRKFKPGPKPVNQSFNSDKWLDLKKSLSKKQREVSRATKFSSQDFLEAEPHMLRSVFGESIKIDVNFDENLLDSLSDLTDVLKDKNISVKHDLDIKEQLAAVVDKFGSDIGTQEKKVKLTTSFDGVLDPVSKFLSGFSEGIPVPLVIAVVVIAAALVLPKAGKTKWIVIGSLSSMLFMYTKKTDLVSQFTSFFSSAPNEAEPHFNFSSDYSKLLVVLLNCYLCSVSGKGIFSFKDFSKFFADLSRNASGVEYFTQAIVGCFKLIKKSLNRLFNGGEDETFVLTGEEFIDAYLEECYKLCEDHETGKLANNSAGVDRCSINIRLGESVFVKIPGHPDFISTRMLVANSLQRVKKIKETLLCSNFKFTGLRVEPVALMIRGPPGCGKSNSMQHFADAFAAMTFEPEDFEDYKNQRALYIHNRMAETKHWEGYDAKKQIVFYDDLLQQKDVQGVPDNEIFSIVRAVNVFEYQLHMAGMEYKGNTMYRANLLLANSNVTAYKFSSINDTGAFLRRWDFVVDVCPKPEFSTNYFTAETLWKRKVDYSKLPIMENGKSLFHPSQLEFHLQKMKGDDDFEPAGPVYDWRQLIKKVYDKHQDKLGWHYNSCIALDETLSYYRDIRNNVRKEEEEEDVDYSEPVNADAHAGESSKDKGKGPMMEEVFEQKANEVGSHIPFKEGVESSSCKDGSCPRPQDMSDIEFMRAPYGFSREHIQMNAGLFASACDELGLREDRPYLISEPVVRLHGYWMRDYPTNFSNLKYFYLLLYNTLGIQYRIHVNHSILCRILLNEADPAIKQYVGKISEMELVSIVIKTVLESRANSFQMKNFRQAIDRARFDMARVVKSRNLPWYTRVIYDTYVWVTGFGIAAKRDIEDTLNADLDGMERIASYGRYFMRVYVSYIVLKFVGGWILDKMYPQKTLEADKTEPTKFVTLEPMSVEILPLENKAAGQATLSKNEIKRAKRRGIAEAEGHSLASQSPSVMDIVRAVYRRNCYDWFSPVLANRGEKGKPTHEMYGTCLGLKQKLLMVPFHFISMLIQYWEETEDPDAFVEIRNSASKKVVFRTRVKDIYMSRKVSDSGDARDIFCVWFEGMQPCRDITHLFQNEVELSRYTRPNCVLMIPSYPDGKECHTVIAERCAVPLKVKHPNVEPYHVFKTWQYVNDKATNGDCGALLFVDDKSRGNLIIGMHVAGNVDRSLGFSAYLNKEFIDEQCLLYEDKFESCLPKAKVDDLKIEVVQEESGVRDNMELVGSVSAHMGATSSGETKILRSPLWNTYKEATTAPAKLYKFIKDGEEVSPMKLALDKCCQGKPMLDLDRIDRAVENYEAKLYRSSTKNVEKRILSFDEAVIGDGTESLKAIPRVTSAGFPYVKMKGIRTKERFFGKEEAYRLDSHECDELRKTCLDIELKAKIGVRSTHVFIDCLKDERRSLAKVESGNTRLFSAGPTPLLVLMRKYFGSFMKWMNENSIVNGCSLGINPYSRDWDTIGKKFQRFGSGLKNVGAGDFKNFDMSGNAQLYKAVLGIINRWYGDDEEGNMVRTILFEEVLNPLHLNGRKLYYWYSGLSSGILLTTLINNIVNQIIFRICFEMMYGMNFNFNDHVELLTGGDDNGYATSEAASSTFTEVNLAKRFVILGYTFVPEDKNKNAFDDSLRYLSDITFNKREFVYDSHLRRFVGPLELDVVLESPMWLRKSACSIADIEVKVEQCLDELSLHSKEVYDLWCPRVLENSLKVPGIRRPEVIEYHALRRQVLERGSTPLLMELLESGSIDAYAHSWLRTDTNESHDGKVSGSLQCVRERYIYSYCQEALPAVLVNSRSHGFSDSLARGQFITRATETNTNNNPEPAGNEPASLLPQTRTEPGRDLFLANSTTKGVDDSDIVRAVPVNYRPLQASLLNQPKSGVSQEISNFLAKPVLLSNGVFSVTDTIPANIYTVAIPRTVINANPVWKDKLSGNFAFRGTLCLTWQVNANRFQQGRYILAWIPDGGADLSVNQGRYLLGHSANLCQTTQLPHVEIDIACDTTAYMEVPIINTIGYSSVPAALAPKAFENGQLIMRPYSPLVSPTGSNSCSWALYGHWKDIQWFMPAVPHSNARVTKRVSRRGNAEKMEQESAGIGPIENMMSTISSAASSLAGVPYISSVAGPVAWASDISAKLAGAFGWSKPHNSSTPTKMNRYIMSGYNNADTADNSTKLAVLDKARLEEVPGFGGSDLDELSFSYLTTIPAWTQTIPWTTLRNEGDVLSNLPVNPRDHVVNSTYGAQTLTFPTPVAWVSNFFSLWRGSLKFTFKIVKTEFHSGRLLAAFLPYDFNVFPVPATPSISDTVFLHREIIDVRYGNEFSITIPFISLSSYKQIFGSDRSTGLMVLYVLNPLVAPASVSSSVDILLEVSGCDMEFAQPRDILEIPCMTAVAQSGNTCAIIEADIGNSSVSGGLETATSCVGERILSLRSLLKRFSSVAALGSTATPYFQFFPFSIPCAVVDGAFATTGSEFFPNDTVSNITLPFALVRGSMKYKFIRNDASNQALMRIRSLPWSLAESGNQYINNFQYIAAPVYQLGGGGNGSNNTLQYSHISGGMEIEFPYYNRTWCHPVSDALTNHNVGTFQYNPTSMAPRTLSVLECSSTTTIYSILRAGGEDYSPGLFVSIPAYMGWSTHNS